MNYYSFSEHNRQTLSEHGINDDFVWGKIAAVHSIGNIHIVEYEDRMTGAIKFHPYVNGKDTHGGSNSLDGAILVALGEKYDGINSQFSRFASRMLGMK